MGDAAEKKAATSAPSTNDQRNFDSLKNVTKKMDATNASSINDHEKF